MLKWLAFFLAFCSAGLSLAQLSEVGDRSKKLFDVIQLYHFNDVDLNDSTSSFIFDRFLEEMDPSGMIFLQEDITKLSAFRYKIDDEIKGKKVEFFALFADLFKERLLESRTYHDQVSAMKLDFLKEESVDLDDDAFFAYCETKEQLSEKWRLWTKYSILEEIFDYEYVDSADSAPVDSLLQYVDEIRASIFEGEEYYIKGFLENPIGYEAHLGTFYLNAIANSFDPHTTYFSPVEKEKFEDELSRGNFEFGFSLQEKEGGKVEVSGLIPGSPAWNCNEINVGDQVLSIVLDGKKKVDLRKKSLEDLQIQMYNLNPEKVVLNLLKQNGVSKQVELGKGEVYVEEDVIKSVILEGDQKIGYITLPDFYTDWDEEGTLGCANDMAKVIVKLQKENIDGLILDLRNNGGGSLREAIDLGGIFIDWGPLCVYKQRGTNPSSIKDMNRGSIYNGPLVILVNGLSASASEIFSASMQDYNRAVIVGSPTYGKATGQSIYPLDVTTDKYGFVKVTNSKFYRVNKKTHQKLGVQPDVMIKDVFELYDYSESNHSNALSNDSVVKKLYFTPGPAFQSQGLTAGSKSRLSIHEQFQHLMTVLDSIENSSFGEGVVSLHIERYQERDRAFNQLLGNLFEEDSYQTSAFQAINNQFDQKIIQLNEYRRKLNEEYLKNVQSDLYIEESYFILSDLIQMTTE